MAYVEAELPFTQEGENIGSDGIERTVVNLARVLVDLPDVRRLAAHYKERTDAGLLPLASECRELAAPLMKAMMDAGYAEGSG